MAIQLTLTDVGIEALINAQKDGTNALNLSSVQFGTGKYKTSPEQTELMEPFKTLTTISGGAVGNNIILIGIRDTDVRPIPSMKSACLPMPACCLPFTPRTLRSFRRLPIPMLCWHLIFRY